jgi:hypothetical protein
MTLPPWLKDRLANTPTAGAGVHGWLFSVARQLHQHMPPDAIAAALRKSVEKCGRHVTDRELRDAVNNSHAVRWTPGDRQHARKPSPGKPGMVRPHTPDATPWPMPDEALREVAVCRANECGVFAIDGAEDDPPIGRRFTLDDLWMHCMSRRDVSFLGDNWPESTWDAGDWLDVLFPDAEWICLARADLASAQTRRREKWAFREYGFTYVVPSPMTASHGLGLHGKETSRCLANTGPRRWLVVEFDDGTADEQAALHWYIDSMAAGAGWPRLRLAVHSGGKSLHGWYGPITDEETARDLFAFARWRCGCDLHTWPKCQLVRLPEGIHANGKRQRVHFHSPPFP